MVLASSFVYTVIKFLTLVKRMDTLPEHLCGWKCRLILACKS